MLFTKNKAVYEPHVKKLCDIITWTTGYSSWYISVDFKTQIPDNHIIEPWQGYLKKHLKQLFKQEKLNHHASGICTLDYHDLILYQVIYYHNQIEGVLAIGPVKSSNVKETIYQAYKEENKELNTVLLSSYFDRLNTMEPIQYQSFLYLLKILETSQYYKPSDLNPLQIELGRNVQIEPYKITNNTIKHHTLEQESILLKNLLTSDKNPSELFSNLTDHLMIAPLAPEVLRSEKNRFISAISVICRETIRLGVNSEIAFNYTDYFIYRVEEIQSIESLSELYKIVLSTFKDEITRSKKNKEFTHTISLILEEIDENYSKNLSLKYFSEQYNYSYKYLSQLFLSEVGITFKSYVENKKIERAKELLIATDYKIEEIADQLNFGYSYYFSKVFKKNTGLSPSDYRRKKNI